MALLPILHFPDPRLHKVAKPVAQMYDAPGVGLAATQVDVHEQVIVIDVSEDRSGFMALINPEILEKSDELQTYEEGCLSVPGIYDEVKRAARIRVRALGLDGKPFEFEAEGLLAVCVQHEMDHLRGKVFVEHLSYLKQTRIRAKLRKQERELSRA
jgi:peptide deformylase